MTRTLQGGSRAVRILTLMAASAAAVAAQGGFQGTGSYEIANLQSGRVLDLDRNDQTTVIQYSARNTENQRWEIQSAGGGFYFIRNMMNGNALEAVSDRKSSPVRGLPFNGNFAQQWRFERARDGNTMIVNRNGKAIDIPDGSNREGVRIQIYDANGEENQSFVLRRVSGGGRWGGGGGNWRNQGNQGGFQGNQGGYQGNSNRSGGGWGNQGDNRSGNMPGWGNARRLTCSSNDGRRAFCDVNTAGGVRLVRQISGSACREGHGWGVNDRGIWVDHGCRAEFEVAQPRGRGSRD